MAASEPVAPRRRARSVGLFRLLFAALTFAALTARLSVGLGREDFSVVNFFSFFTVESNAFAALVLALSGSVALRAGTLQLERFATLRVPPPSI